MEKKDLGTIGGEKITQEMLDSYSATFERDWSESEISINSTERGRVLRALHELNIPIHEIEALERRANHRQQSLVLYIHSILKQELFVTGDTP